MSRYQPYSRRVLKSRYRQWARRNVKALAILVAGALAILVVVTVWMMIASPATGFRWYSLGVFHATVVGACLFLANMMVMAHDGQAIRHLRGAWGEELTRDELSSAKRRRLIWGWVDSINLRAGDLDHVVIARRGGILVLDSKWRIESSGLDRDEMVRSAHRARQRAEALGLTLLAKQRGARHRATGKALTVRAAVVVWGPFQHKLEEPIVVEGIDFVPGRRLRSWLRSVDGEPVPGDAATDLLRRLRAFRARAWEPAVPPGGSQR